MFSLNKATNLRIETKPEEMYEGLFGQTILWTFEMLPFLRERGIFPDWSIRAAYYGSAVDSLVIPGVLDLAYDVQPGPKQEVNLLRLRGRQHVLGNDWQALSALWHTYFRIPARILETANRFGPLSDCLGVHYRGNDKQTAVWDTNPVSYDDYLVIIRQFCQERPEFRRIFLATDDLKFHNFLKSNIALDVITLGGAGFHKDRISAEATEAKTDRAMLDCLLLSRCGAVLLTSSALPSFAKVLNTDLEIYRVAASKFFSTRPAFFSTLFEINLPYFPVAYIPPYSSTSPQVSAVIDRLMTSDWTQTIDTRSFTKRFVSRPLLSPALRLVYLIYFYGRSFPGLHWLAHIPKLVEEAYRKRLRVPPRQS